MIHMKKVVLACIGALLLCAACVTAEDLDCWYDDMCLSDASAAPATHHDASPPVSGR